MFYETYENVRVFLSKTLTHDPIFITTFRSIERTRFRIKTSSQVCQMQNFINSDTSAVSTSENRQNVMSKCHESVPTFIFIFYFFTRFFPVIYVSALLRWATRVFYSDTLFLLFSPLPARRFWSSFPSTIPGSEDLISRLRCISYAEHAAPLEALKSFQGGAENRVNRESSGKASFGRLPRRSPRGSPLLRLRRGTKRPAPRPLTPFNNDRWGAFPEETRRSAMDVEKLKLKKIHFRIS